MTEGNRSTTCQQCGNTVQAGDRFCGNCGATVLPPAPQAEQVIPRPVAASQAPPSSNKKPLLLAGALGLLLLLLVGGGALALLGSNNEERSDPSERQPREVAGPPQEDEVVAPGLEDAVEEWASDTPKGAYILVPGYLPFDVVGYSNYLDSGNPEYGMYYEDSDGSRYGLNIGVIDPNNVALYERHGTVEIEGRSYYYNEPDMCSLFLWETSGGPQAFWLFFLGSLDCAITDEQLPEVLTSMVRVEGEEADSTSEESEDYGTTESTSSASPEPTASASPDSSASPSSEEETLEEFGREYVEASRRGDWEATYSMLDESSQQNFTEAEWAEAQRIMREAEGPPAPLESVSVEQNEEMSDVPATLTLHYEDGTEDTMIAVVPMVVEDESDSGVPKRVLIGQEIGEIRAVASSGQSIEEMMVEAEEAAGDYYRAAGSEDWAYTYENLDSQTQSLFTREEWFQKNQWFADSGEVIYHVESVGMTGTNSEFVGVTLTLTYEDGTSSTRDTYFVYENGSWKHRFGQEENDLFMPDLSYEEFVQAQG